jgi:hypothetical protein
MKGSFIKPKATKDPFINRTLTKDPFINAAPPRTRPGGASPHHELSACHPVDLA